MPEVLPLTLFREEMQSLFEPHLERMLKKIREQLDLVQLKAFGNPQVVGWQTIVINLPGRAC